MVKFPSQNKLMYAGATVSNGSFAETHKICLPRDLSIVNRRGYEMTTRKGVPLVYRVAATVYPSGIDGSGYYTTEGVRTTAKFIGGQNNWTAKNASVMWHAAREKMFRDAGVKKKDRGAYSHTIRYNYSGQGESYSDPVDGVGSAFTGGTWDTSDLSYPADNDFGLILVGNGDDQESNAFTGTTLQFAHAYLLARANQQLDTNREIDEGPAQFSVLNQLLHGDSGADSAIQDDIIEEARNAQDNPPYEVLDLSDSGDVGHDVTEEVEFGRVVLSPLGTGAVGPQTTVIDVPFGLLRVLMAHRDSGDDSSVTDDLALGLEVLSIYEMQG